MRRATRNRNRVKPSDDIQEDEDDDYEAHQQELPGTGWSLMMTLWSMRIMIGQQQRVKEI